MMLTLFLFNFLIQSPSDETTVGRGVVQRLGSGSKDKTFKITSLYKNMLVILKPEDDMKISAFYTKKGKESKELKPEYPAILFFKNQMGYVNITPQGDSTFGFTATCLPDECVDRIYAANLPNASISISDKPESKWDKMSSGHTYCMLFGNLGSNSNYEVTRKINSKSHLYFRRADIEDKVDETEIMKNDDIPTENIYFKATISGSGKDRNISILDNSDNGYRSLYSPMAKFMFGGWVYIDNSLSGWTVALIIILVLIMCVALLFIFYYYFLRNTRKEKGEYSNLTELPVENV